MSLLDQYIKRFGEKPPKLMTTNYNNEIYQRLMKEALEDNIPITWEDVEEAFENTQYDVFQS